MIYKDNVTGLYHVDLIHAEHWKVVIADVVAADQLGDFLQRVGAKEFQETILWRARGSWLLEYSPQSFPHSQ